MRHKDPSLRDTAHAARLMAESAVGHTLALRVVITLLVAGLPIEEPHVSRILDALVRKEASSAAEFRNAVLSIIEDISISAGMLSGKN